MSEDERTYGVVLNDEEQYSIWLVDRELPHGLAVRGEARSQAGVPRPHRRGVDGHAAEEPAGADAGGRSGLAAASVVFRAAGT